jgi:nicotinic acid mononucleotide adenylyltransferase
MTKKKKEASKKASFNPEKYIEIHPELKEAKSKTVVMAFGRFNPITSGHQKLVNRVITEASKRKADAVVFASHSQDKKKNPLSYDDKIRYMQIAFGNIVKKSKNRTALEVAKDLQKSYDNLVFVVGSDRVEEFNRLLQKYNGIEYNFDSIEVVSAGERDPDADDVTGMSASKMRGFAAEGNFESFKSGLPTKLQRIAKSVYDDVRRGMGLTEDLEEENLEERAPLTISQRRQRARTMRRYKNKIKTAKKRAQRRKASPEKLKLRARRKARNLIRQRLAGGRKYDELTSSEKVALDKRLLRIPDAVISRMATRHLPKVRQAEMDRLASIRAPKTEEVINELFDDLINEITMCTPKKPHMLMTKEGKVKIDRRFKFFRKNGEVQEEVISEQPTALERTREAIQREKESDKQRHQRMRETAKSADASRREQESARQRAESLEKSPDDPCWKGYVQLGTKKKKGKEVPNCVPMESTNSADREEGTDSLVRIYKKDTPGQHVKESYNNSDLSSDYGTIKRGDRVRFTSHSMDAMESPLEKTGTVVNSNTSGLKVRTDAGTLFKVRHDDVELIEMLYFEREDMRNLVLETTDQMQKALSAIHKHVLRGRDLKDVVWDLVMITGIDIGTQDLMRAYIEKYGKTKNLLPAGTLGMLKKKYGM